jgi:transposase
MPIRRSPNGARHVRPQPGRNRPERVVAINRNAWSQSVGTGGRNHPVRAHISTVREIWLNVFFNKIKQCRRIATRYDRLAANYLAFIKLASIRIWLRAYESAP